MHRFFIVLLGLNCFSICYSVSAKEQFFHNLSRQAVLHEIVTTCVTASDKKLTLRDNYKPSGLQQAMELWKITQEEVFDLYSKHQRIKQELELKRKQKQEAEMLQHKTEALQIIAQIVGDEYLKKGADKDKMRYKLRKFLEWQHKPARLNIKNKEIDEHIKAYIIQKAKIEHGVRDNA